MENKIKATKDRIEHIVNNFDGTRSLTNTVDNQNLLSEVEISALVKDKDRLTWRA